MKKASIFFTDEEKKSINGAVTAAEKNTSGEIVPVLASASGRYDRAEDIAGLWLACIVLTLAWVCFQGLSPVEGWSDQAETVRLGLVPILAIFVGTFIIGVAVTSRVWFIRHLFTGRSMMRECVEESAKQAFYEHQLGGTRDATGVLIYVSLFERMVVVLGDEGISEKLEPDDWGNIRDIIIGGLRDGNSAQGLCDGIAKSGELLATHFPIKEDDTNELPNELVTID